MLRIGLSPEELQKMRDIIDAAPQPSERLRAAAKRQGLHTLQHESDLNLQAGRDGFHFGRPKPSKDIEDEQSGVELDSPRPPSSLRVRAFHIAVFFLFGFVLGFCTLRFLLQ